MTSSTTDPIYELLERKLRQAEDRMAADLERQVWGQPVRKEPAVKGLKQIIGEAYDEHVPPQTNHQIANSFERALKDQIKEHMFRENPLITQLKKNAEEKKTMNDTEIARKAVEKRKEARAEKIAEIVGEYFENVEWSDSDTVSWSVNFHDTPDKTYHYVAIKGGNRWFITGDEERYTVDTIVAKIVTLHLRGTVDGEWEGV